jgi:hypothetical protein
MTGARPIPFRKRRPKVGSLVRPTARLIRAGRVEIAGETVVTPLKAAEQARAA